MRWGKKIIGSIILIAAAGASSAQEDGITYADGGYTFSATYDDSTFIGSLTVTKNQKVIFSNTYEYDRIISINGYDLDGNGKKEYLLDFYTGGAHCCTIMKLARFKGSDLIFADSIYWGNSGYNVEDLDNDDEYELVGYNDMFAYAFTNYAQSFFPIAIFKYNGKFYPANKEFEKTVKRHIKELKDALNEYTVKGFDCPKSEDEETFNTDAGAVKAILAPITADYESIGDAAQGYELINQMYKCPDRDKFVNILKKEYKLK